MTLHGTVEFARKALLGIVLGLTAVIVLFFLFRLGIIVINIIAPPKPQAPAVTFGTLPALKFPKNVTGISMTYTINTVTGALPAFPDRLNVYPIKQPEPNFLNLNKVKSKVYNLEFKDENSHVLPEIALDSTNYEWRETNELKRIIRFNTVTLDFSMTSNYLSSLTVLNAKNLSDQDHAIDTILSFLNSIDQVPTDVDREKSTTELLSITNGATHPTTSLSTAQAIRVDLHQKDITYDLNTGTPQTSGGFKIIPLTLSILYPTPPYSTMSFWVASALSQQQVVAADFIYQATDIQKDLEATYPIKTAATALEDLKNGKGYIASYNGSQNTIAINKVYLAYYIGKSPQEYLMPIMVFEGDDGFLAYVSAVKDEWLK